MEPTLRASLGLGFRALRANLWLAPLGMGIGLVASALGVPATGFLYAALARGMSAGLRRAPLQPLQGMAAGAMVALTAPRVLAIFAGLALAAALLGGALRVLYLAGALPTLGRTLSGREDLAPQFATGVAFRFPNVLGAAFLGWLCEASASLAFGGALAGAFLAGGARGGVGRGILAATVAAAALAGALFAMLCASSLATAAVARAALLDEAPHLALARAARRFADRAPAFLAAALFLGLVDVALATSVNAAGGVVGGVARGKAALPLLGARLMTMALAALLTAIVELWRLGAFATLACAGEREPAAEPAPREVTP